MQIFADLYEEQDVKGQLDRCPYCGKWSVVRSLPLAQLRQAEQAELEQARGQIPEISEEERLKKELDDSRYLGM